MERRKSTRIPFSAPATIRAREAASLDSHVQNISDHGIFITSEIESRTGDTVVVSIMLQEGDSSLTITLPCTVARIAENGIGCMSQHIDVELLLFSSNLLSSQGTKDSPNVMNRFLEFVNEHEFHAA